MLSIIISSYQPDYFTALEKNIAETCGVPYEIIKVDNPGIMGICEAYNRGAEKAKYDNMLFLHEDVLFETNDWGHILLEKLQISNVGVVGVAGSNYYGYIPSGCWNPTYFKHINQFEHDSFTLYDKSNFKNKTEKVKVVDGVFLACLKRIYEEIMFNDKIKGYHGYDLIFTLSASEKFQNYVTSEILIKHYSLGNISKEWLQNIIQVRKIIPAYKKNRYIRSIEMKNFYRLIELVDAYESNYFKKIYTILTYCNINVLGLYNVLKILNRLRFLRFRNSPL